MTNENETVIKTDSPQWTGDTEITVEQWLAIRKEVGLQIDAETAEVE